MNIFSLFSRRKRLSSASTDPWGLDRPNYLYFNAKNGVPTTDGMVVLAVGHTWGSGDKPRIKSALPDHKAWICAGCGREGFGKTPKIAYDRWYKLWAFDYPEEAWVKSCMKRVA